jgi:ATP-dependent helicase YprA (DUF1998 family)
MRSMEAYPRAAMERAMKVQDVMLQAMAKKITWWQAAEILGISDRHMRRWRERYVMAGRGSGSSCAVFLASSAPLDQFIVQHPDYFFGSSPEHAHIQPGNLEILVNHLKCAAFELPISPEEKFGDVDVAELCEQLGEAGFVHQSGGNWHWIDEAYPADTVSLRSVTSDNFVIIDTSGEEEGKAVSEQLGHASAAFTLDT